MFRGKRCALRNATTHASQISDYTIRGQRISRIQRISWDERDKR